MAASYVTWNDNALTTTYESPTALSAVVSQTLVSAAGSAQVRVRTSGSDPSAPAIFSITPFPIPGLKLRTLSLVANKLQWDAANQVIYATIPSAAGPDGNSIATLDPASGTLSGFTPVGSEPNLLSLSAGAKFLYVSLDGSCSVKRLKLPGLADDLSLALGRDSFFGPYWAKDLQASPEAAETVAVSLGSNRGGSPEALGGVVVFDNAVARTTVAAGWNGSSNLYDTLQWGKDNSRIYAADYETTGFEFFTLAVDPSGVALLNTFGSVFHDFNFRIHFDPRDGLIYADTGEVVDPMTGYPAGTLPFEGLVAPDAGLDRTFILVSSYSGLNLVVCKQSRLNVLNVLDLHTFIKGNVSMMIRYGSDGLALVSDAGFVYFLSGPALTGSAS